ncbi:Lin0512 family protein [uncultured Desulfobacter sp.]|uniref:Lin0512 family protein n=1 Tax=uncultured Desulfobacter sp. TaxID=240139 RepID=UPI002AA6A1A2|nr:Lin0512 family protein [uncultured Desulfobacter sp.]
MKGPKMAGKRFVVELGTGVDLHGNDVTKAACRAVKDAVSRSCLCGIIEVLDLEQFQGVHVDVLVACPEPDLVDEKAVKAQLPVGTKSVTTTLGGMCAKGICVDTFAKGCDTIIVANAAVTVWVDVN